MAETFDVVIIGSGPGGYVAAIRAGQLGLKTAIVERDKRLGGTCLHRGCIPTKSLLWTAELWAHMLDAAEFGIDLQSPVINWAQAMKHKTKVVTKGANGIDYLMKKNKVQVVKGHGPHRRARARWRSPRRAAEQADAGDQEHHPRHRLACPSRSPRFQVDHKLVFNSDSILEVDEDPQEHHRRSARARSAASSPPSSTTSAAKTTLVEYLPAPAAHRGRGRQQGDSKSSTGSEKSTSRCRPGWTRWSPPARVSG